MLSILMELRIIAVSSVISRIIIMDLGEMVMYLDQIQMLPSTVQQRKDQPMSLESIWKELNMSIRSRHDSDVVDRILSIQVSEMDEKVLEEPILWDDFMLEIIAWVAPGIFSKNLDLLWSKSRFFISARPGSHDSS